MSDLDAARKIQHFATRLIRIARTSGKGHAISSAQYSAMALLSASPGMSVVELARREGVAHPTISRLVAGLEKAGLIDRVHDPDDRRSTRLSLTATGEQTYQEVAGRRVMMFQMLLAQLSPSAVQEFLDLIDRSTLAMEEALRRGQDPDT